MSLLNAANEILIRESLATTLSAVANIGFVQPSPLYLEGIESFWSTFDANNDTKTEIENARIAACWIYPIGFEDIEGSGCVDKPLTLLTYEFYLFRQYGLEREDETATPNLFDSEVLKGHNEFVSAWLGIKEAFQGIRKITGLESEFATSNSTPVVQVDLIQNQAVCDFVPGAVGFAVRLQETVRLLSA